MWRWYILNHFLQNKKDLYSRFLRNAKSFCFTFSTPSRRGESYGGACGTCLVCGKLLPAASQNRRVLDLKLSNKESGSDWCCFPWVLARWVVTACKDTWEAQEENKLRLQQNWTQHFELGWCLKSRTVDHASERIFHYRKSFCIYFSWRY